MTVGSSGNWELKETTTSTGFTVICSCNRRLQLRPAPCICDAATESTLSRCIIVMQSATCGPPTSLQSQRKSDASVLSCFHLHAVDCEYLMSDEDDKRPFNHLDGAKLDMDGLRKRRSGPRRWSVVSETWRQAPTDRHIDLIIISLSLCR